MLEFINAYGDVRVFDQSSCVKYLDQTYIMTDDTYAESPEETILFEPGREHFKYMFKFIRKQPITYICGIPVVREVRRLSEPLFECLSSASDETCFFMSAQLRRTAQLMYPNRNIVEPYGSVYLRPDDHMPIGIASFRKIVCNKMGVRMLRDTPSRATLRVVADEVPIRVFVVDSKEERFSAIMEYKLTSLNDFEHVQLVDLAVGESTIEITDRVLRKEPREMSVSVGSKPLDTIVWTIEKEYDISNLPVKRDVFYVVSAATRQKFFGIRFDLLSPGAPCTIDGKIVGYKVLVSN